MKLTGERLIAAPRADVWAALNDAEVLKASIPGCTEMAKTAEDAFEATVTQKVGPVKATFKGSVTLSDIVEAERYTITGEGKGGAAGFAKGGANITLEDADPPEGATGPATLLRYEADAKVGGKLAQLGSRLIDGYARKTADEFFDRFAETISGPAPAADPAPTEAAPAPEPTAPAALEPQSPAPAQPEPAAEQAQEKKGWFSRLFG